MSTIFRTAPAVIAILLSANLLAGCQSATSHAPLQSASSTHSSRYIPAADTTAKKVVKRNVALKDDSRGNVEADSSEAVSEFRQRMRARVEAWRERVAKSKAAAKARSQNALDKKNTAKGAKSGAGKKGVPYEAVIRKYAAQEGVPIDLAMAVVSVESRFRANARGRAGEVGLMQIKPATARGMGYRGSTKGLYDPETNLKWGMKYLGEAHRLAGGSTCGTILKYNAGHGAKRMNKISRGYCGKVKRILS